MAMKSVPVVLAVAVVLAGCMAPAGPATAPLDDPAPADAELLAHLEQLATFPEMRIQTDVGTIRAILYADWTPQTVAHIGGLAADGFYDGLTIHRVVDDFVIQSGDPTGTGEGGSGPGGLSTNMVPLEIKEGLDFGSGAIGLARWTDDTGDSQWFITEKPALHLSRPSGVTGDVFGAYSLFGQVFEGMDVVRQIAAVETIEGADRPVEDVFVTKAELLPPPGDVDLIGLVPVIGAGAGVLEAPRWIVEGHPFTVRYSLDAGCSGGDKTVRSFEATDIPLQAVDWDPCTWEGTGVAATPPVGMFGPGDEVVQQAFGGPAGGSHFRWVPWHDAYLPFTGTGNATSTR